MSELRFDGRVAIITGAGRGIGLEYAKLLADRGARVVVNDLGSPMDGAGADLEVAAQAAAAIRDRGGVAEPDCSDVSTAAGARAIVQRALDSFGRVDIVVNNAGIFWTDRFPAIDIDALNRQLAVHLGGGFAVSQAAWPHMQEAGYGRIVMTTSSAALGSSNLTAYGTAKAAVIGLGRSLAMSGLKSGIKVNMVAPMAMTRMMSAGMRTSPVSSPLDHRDPALVAPLVAVLCHETCPVSGETFSSGMGRFSRLVIGESDGYVHGGPEVTAEDVAANWDTIMDVSDHRVVTDGFQWGEAHFALLER